jgi:multisubunit Na+/H+ antiporter MnhB subunit
MISSQDVGQLMIIYGIGAVCIFLVLMYRYALQKAEKLDLNEIEVFDTKTSIRTTLLMVIVPAISVLLALIFINSWLAGPISGCAYFLYTPIMILHGKNVDRKRKQLLQSIS